MKIPQSWKDITINQYIETLPSSMEGKSDIEAIIHRLKVLCNISHEQARDTTVSRMYEVIEQLKFMEQPPKGVYKKRFKLNGQWYEVSPDIRDHKADNYMFCMDRLKELNRDPETIEKNLHLIMAIVCIPMKRSGFKWVKDEQKDILKLSTEFYEDLTMDIVFPISVFFCELSRSLTGIINDSLTQRIAKAEEIQKAIKEDLTRSTGG